MPDKQGNISEEKVRVPPALMAELRRVAGEAMSHGNSAPVFGELLLEAWNGWMAARAGKPLKAEEERPEKRLPAKLQPYVGICIEILGSGDKEAIDTLVLNLRMSLRVLQSRAGKES